MRTLIEAIASSIDAWHRCQPGDVRDMHEARLNALADQLPSGAGIDNGTAILWNESTADKIRLAVQFHHMNEHGMYDGWTEHVLTIRPSFIGRLRFSSITGPDRNQVKDYLAETFDYALTQPEVQHAR